mmetsp:Transcript_13143/g.37307  ORF Transcript_13143/g.37307 Transcript_13143/m.37307 type:complete len:226 (-) Transcript_13143:338-1015(-)
MTGSSAPADHPDPPDCASLRTAGRRAGFGNKREGGVPARLFFARARGDAGSPFERRQRWPGGGPGRRVQGRGHHGPEVRGGYALAGADGLGPLGCGCPACGHPGGPARLCRPRGHGRVPTDQLQHPEVLRHVLRDARRRRQSRTADAGDGDNAAGAADHKVGHCRRVVEPEVRARASKLPDGVVAGEGRCPSLRRLPDARQAVPRRGAGLVGITGRQVLRRRPRQ